MKTITREQKTVTKKLTLTVNWAKELYTVNERTLSIADHRRHCWLCSGAFVIGDGLTVVNTSQGNKMTHSRCYAAQRGDGNDGQNIL